MKRRLRVGIYGALMGLVLWQTGCAGKGKSGEKPSQGAASRPARADAGMRGTRRFIRLPERVVDLPPGPGRDDVAVYCAACHTPGYIMNQPPFTREVWMAEVTKMIKTYSAPIPQENVEPIVNYLVSVNGKGK